MIHNIRSHTVSSVFYQNSIELMILVLLNEEKSVNLHGHDKLGRVWDDLGLNLIKPQREKKLLVEDVYMVDYTWKRKIFTN